MAAGCSKRRSVRPQGDSDPEAYSVPYVEGFERLRTKLGVFFSSLLIVHFDLEAEILDHPPDFRGRLAWCREVAVHEDGVGWIEGEGLETAQIVFPPTGDADFNAWVKKAEEAEHFQAALRGELVAML